MHYSRWKMTGDVGPAHPLRKPGERYRSQAGYVYISGRAEHRMVMEEALGRKLRRGETVHHKNGVRHDNRPENLELWVKPQVAGQRVDDLVAFVVENYPEAVEAILNRRPQLRLVA
jgi:hypothetical protein